MSASSKTNFFASTEAIISVNEALRRLQQGARLLDVRSEIEFETSVVPFSTNVPLLRTDERHQVGITYKVKGPKAAINLGYELVSGSSKLERIEKWRDLAGKNETIIFCARGGLRSKISQEWIYESTKILLPRIEGGYKALRQRFLEELEHKRKLLVVSGPTGVGKTEYLNSKAFDQSSNNFFVIDLEKHARHRGSSFGKMAEKQPFQASFENSIAIDLFLAGPREILIEDESVNIGSCRIPTNLFSQMQIAPKFKIESSFEDRVERILRDYVLSLPEAQVLDELSASVLRIQKKLGGLRTREILSDILDASQNNSLDGHRAWIRKILVWYYDPMYLRST